MRGGVIGCVALFGVAVGGVTLARVGADAGRDGRALSVPSPSTSGAVIVVDSPVAGTSEDTWADADSALDAAVAAVALTDEVVAAGFISRRELIGSFTTASFGPRLADATTAQVAGLLAELGERDVDPASVALVEHPVTAYVRAVDASSAVVEV